MHKRKHRKYEVRSDDIHSSSSARNNDDLALDPCLYIQAHEADIVRGSRALSARLLECPDPSAMLATGHDPKSGLIPWSPPGHLAKLSSQSSLWVDRYDVRFLLDELRDVRSEGMPVRPLSPSGWSDLPSDSEDTFFFSPDELDDYRREKRRRLINRNREDRLRALATINGEEEDPDPWGGSGEEPDEAQRELIRKTATHIISSPNSAQLEMRILANYGTDKRFAFLRGRWSRVWRIEKERAREAQVQEAKKAPSTSPALLGGLTGYGDSDSDSEDESADKQTDAPKSITDTPCTHGDLANEDVVKEARRARAREWSARRREEQPESV